MSTLLPVKGEALVKRVQKGPDLEALVEVRVTVGGRLAVVVEVKGPGDLLEAGPRHKPGVVRELKTPRVLRLPV